MDTSGSGTNIRPSPTPTTRLGPSSPPRYVPCSLIRDSQYMPAAAAADPASSSGRAPTRCTSPLATTDAATRATVSGRNEIPVRSAEYPQTSCANNVMKKNTPKIAVPAPSMIRFAPARFRLRSSRAGSSAWRLRVSMTTNAASSATPTASDVTTLALPQYELPPGLVAAADDRP